MSRLAPATCGFLPVHLYEGPELERALGICSAINAFGLEELGLAKADPKAIADLSLRDMLDALETVERWNRRPHTTGGNRWTSMVPAERLTASVYTLVHFCNRASCGQSSDDHVPVRFTTRRWGEDIVHFLAVGARVATEIDEFDEQEDAA